jgi:signal transduction histidine kinase
MGSIIEERLRETFARSQEVAMQAHLRAQAAIERASRIRESLQTSRDGRGEAGQRVRLLQLAVDESSRSLYEKDRFLATVSHELRQPVNAALAALQLVENGGEHAAAARVVLRRQLLQVARLLDDLLDMSRASLSGMPVRDEPVNVRGVIGDAVATVQAEAAARGLTLTAALPDGEVHVRGDGGRLRQVFSNLLSNAVRYTPAGGRIRIDGAINGGVIEVAIADNGEGIAAADLARIFDPFTRANDGYDGLGIGLAVVRSIVQQHRGTVVARSDGRGRGSCFTVTLPCCVQPPAADGP